MSETLEKERGRVEHRQCFVTSRIDWFDDKDQWKNLRTFVKMQTYCHVQGKERTETRYFITDLPADAERILAATRDLSGSKTFAQSVILPFSISL